MQQRPSLHITSSFRELSFNSENDRGHWVNKAEFMLSCIGLSVGLGNVWRFPVLAYENGGAAFFIPYIILQLLIGKPMYFMELALGQYAGLGPVGIWAMNPSAKGIGVSMALISLVTTIFYNVVMAYTVYYFFASFTKKLPWTWCRQKWKDENCWVRAGEHTALRLCNNGTLDDMSNQCKCSSNARYDFNLSHLCSPGINASYTTLLKVSKKEGCRQLLRCINTTRSPADIYFYENVVQRSDDMSTLGSPLWYLVLCLIFSWIVVILCLAKGIKSSGKVVYFTATFPYVILLVLLIGGSIQPGSAHGVLYFLKPSLKKLLNVEVWKNAAGQVFFSLSIAFGAIIMFGSYNKFHNNVYRDALIISLTDILTSFLAGLVVFTTLGSMSFESGIPIEEVASKGYGLAFVAYPEALSRLPVPQIWSTLFFFMMFTLGLDSEFAFLETVLICVQDEIPRLRQHKVKLCIVSGVICFLLAQPLITPGGFFLLEIMDSYGATYPVILAAFGELVAVSWVYGVRRFSNDIKEMLGYTPHFMFYWVFCWLIAAPLLIGIIFIYYLSVHEPLKYPTGEFHGSGAQAISWLLFTSICLPIPVFFCIAVYNVKGETNFIQRIYKATRPTADWVPQADFDAKTQDITLAANPAHAAPKVAPLAEEETFTCTDESSRVTSAKVFPIDHLLIPQTDTNMLTDAAALKKSPKK